MLQEKELTKQFSILDSYAPDSPDHVFASTVGSKHCAWTMSFCTGCMSRQMFSPALRTHKMKIKDLTRSGLCATLAAICQEPGSDYTFAGTAAGRSANCREFALSEVANEWSNLKPEYNQVHRVVG